MDDCTKNYCEKENSLFFKNLGCFIIHIFMKKPVLFVNLGFNIKIKPLIHFCIY